MSSTDAYQQRYSPGTRVWLPSKEKVWIPAKVTSYSPTNLDCEHDDGSSKSVSIPIKAPEKDLPPLRNPDILIGQNDLTSLSYLHEPAVLYNLEYRFSENNFIYTYCGIVLVAINPYEELPIYGKETVWAYRGHNWGELDPHIFAVAEDAFTKMERENRDQSIIVSGESGAGKTVSAKYAMRYFATVGGSENETQIEKKVLASSPIMEAIGNAKTTRNDNSSRFGKYVEVNFDSKYSIIGASMRTYLLEKSRVVFQSDEERNYHIFYQLCSSRNSHPEVSELFLSASSDFHYTSQGRAEVIDGVSDEKLFLETVEALTLLGFGIDDRRNFFKLLASILHLGNVQILPSDGKKGDDSSSTIPKDDPHLENFASLLQVDGAAMRKWLTCRKIVTGREEFIKPMSQNDAINCRDALAKLLYAEAFSWIVAGVNRCLLTSQKTTRFIGVLDIYGFETFEINSFEQFCINYANEKLQQQFNQHVFKLEQEEYVREEIQWTFIEFYDNQPCIDLIESKLGILDLLDEECRMPKGSDSSWCQKLYQKCGAGNYSAHFEKPRMSQTAFIVVHFADRVQYESQGFLEKNRDTVLPDQIMTVGDSKNTWISRLLEPKDAPAQSGPPKPGVVKVLPAGGTMSTSMRKKTVGSQFRDSLTLLMQSLNATTPHYVRCIKPNDSKTPFEFDPHRAVQQLRACGVLETIRISAAGFPSRWTYLDFFSRYRPLVKSSKDINRQNHRLTCEKIVSGMITDEDQYRFGKSKIFFRAGQVAYLEKVRMDKMRTSAIIIQKNVRGFIYKKRYGKIKNAVRKLQCLGRGMLARRLALRLRQTRACIRIQTCWRRWKEQRKFQRIKTMTISLQSRARGYLARKKCMELRRVKAAKIIQKWVRGWLARVRYDRRRQNIIKVQSCVRRWLAKRRLKELKTEARSLEHVKQLNKGLENKIISLQQKIEEYTKSQGKDKKAMKEYEKLKIQLENYKHMEKDLKAALEKIGELNELNEKLEDELRTKMDAEVDFVTTKVELDSENDRLRKIMKDLEESVEKSRAELEESRQKEEEMIRIKKEYVQFEKEREIEQQAYQQLLKKVHDMEQQLVGGGHEMKSGSSRPTPVPRRSLAPSSLESGLSSMDRSPSPTRRALQVSSQIQQNQTKEEPDIGLVLVLQQKLKQSEKDKESLEKLLEEQSSTNPDSETRRTQDLIRLQELEMENAKLKDDLNKLRSSDDTTLEISRQFQSLQEELARKREESIQLRTVLASPKGKKSPGGDSNQNGEELVLNGDDEDEIGLILQTQKKIIQQLEKELQAEKIDKQDLSSHIKSMEEEIQKQSLALSTALGGGGGDLHLRHEVGRLTNENLTLRDHVAKLKAELKRSKRHHDSIVGVGSANDSMSTAGNMSLDHVYLDIKKKNLDYLGMLEYRQEDEGKIMRALILDLQPAIALSAQPSGLPAFILFMMIRYTDYINDDNKVRSLLTSAITYIKRLMRKKGETLDVTVLWLSNILRFLHTLKQYSGDQAFQQDNSPKQNDQCLKNFDLSEYRQVLSDHAVWIYMMLLKILEQDIQTMIVPAILENTGIDGGGSGGVRSGEKQKPLDSLIRKLDVTYNLLCSYGLDVEVINQVFRQLFYYVCAGALNNLLLRRELCNWSKGLDIRYNVSALEEWGRTKKMEEVVKTTLNPVIQASKILQARKSDNDVDVGTICGIAENLSIQQVVKLLNLYSSKDGIDADKVSKQFIEKVQSRLWEMRAQTIEQQEQLAKSKLLMDTQFTFAVKFPFNPSSVKLEEVNLPESFGIDQWVTIK